MFLWMFACADPKPPVAEGDLDGDGFFWPEDCDDSDPDVSPGQREIWYDGVNNDCDDTSDDHDQDGDGHQVPGDCDDTDPHRFPSAWEDEYDGVDSNCDGSDPDDLDQDGYSGWQVGGPDCDDQEPETWPGAPDAYGDWTDSDCDGMDGEDQDGDGEAAEPGPDCDDTDPAIFPGAPEVWYDGIDQGCDGGCDFDQDGDGFAAVGAQSPCDAVFDCDDVNPEANDGEIVERVPEVGAVDVEIEDSIVLELSELDPTAQIVVRDAAGVEMPGTSTVDVLTVTWTPDVPLAPDAPHEAELQYECGSEPWLFVTGPEPLPLEPESLVGRTWSLAVSGFHEGWLLTVLSAGEETLELRVAGDLYGVQDPCVPTTDVSADFSANPTLSLQADLPFRLLPTTEGVLGSVMEATLSGVFRGDRLTDASGSGLAYWGPLCGLLACGPCSDGTVSCGSYRWEEDPPEVEIELISITPEQIALDTRCL